MLVRGEPPDGRYRRGVWNSTTVPVSSPLPERISMGLHLEDRRDALSKIHDEYARILDEETSTFCEQMPLRISDSEAADPSIQNGHDETRHDRHQAYLPNDTTQRGSRDSPGTPGSAIELLHFPYCFQIVNGGLE